MCLKRIAMGLLLLGLIIVSEISSKIQLNSYAIKATKKMHGEVLIDPGGRPNGCGWYWFRGLLADFEKDEVKRYRAWEEALSCDPRYVSLIYKKLPENRDFAELAAKLYPRLADSWFWLAESQIEIQNGFYQPVKEKSQAEIIEYYQKGLALNPVNSHRWRILGDLLSVDDPKAAIDAYLQSCFRGDFHHNGCWRAARTAEKIGDIENAIRYYRYSDLPSQIARGDDLDATIRDREIAPSNNE